MILYINRVKKGEPTNYTYIEKVAKSWMKAGIKTAEDAVKYMDSLKDKETKTKRGKKVVEEPEWMKEDYKVEVQELTEEEKKEAEELAARLLG